MWIVDNSFPKPAWDIVCPQCHSDYIRASLWKFSTIQDVSGKNDGMCRVAFRCLVCNLWWEYQVPIEIELFEYHRAHGRTNWRWQDVMATLEQTNQKLFPNLTPDEVLKVVSEHWDLTGNFPLPKWDVVCSSCRQPRVQAQFWRFSRYTSHNGRNPYRCNVSMKCTHCSHVMMFGVFIPEAMYQYHLTNGVKSYHWREVRRLLQEVV